MIHAMIRTNAWTLNTSFPNAEPRSGPSCTEIPLILEPPEASERLAPNHALRSLDRGRLGALLLGLGLLGL